MADIYTKVPIGGFGGYTDEQLTRGLSKEFFRISRPPEVVDPKDVTTEFKKPIIHPSTGQYAVVIPDEVITKSNLASSSRLIEFLTSVLNQTKIDNIVAYFQNTGSIDLQLLWGYAFPNQTMTHAEMDAEGWFATEEI